MNRRDGRDRRRLRTHGKILVVTSTLFVPGDDGCGRNGFPFMVIPTG